MGTITTGIGLISGINTKDLIDQLISIEARPKTLVQNRISLLTAQQTAFQEVNAKLLALKLSASSLAKSSLFQTTKAASSDESVLTASATTAAVPGSYAFTVGRLVTAQQTISRGFADADAVPMPSGSLTLEAGAARLAADVSLASLNGGEGVTRGKIRITDRSGASATVDLATAVTVQDVLDAINGASGINVTASVHQDGLRITDQTGASAANLTVANVGTSNTAAGLGLAGSVAADTLTGSQIHRLSEDTALSVLNDGNGVRYATGNDFTITRRDGSSFTVDLTENDTKLGDVIDKINAAAAASGGNLLASINSDGTGLLLTDGTGGAGDLGVAAVNASSAAADLGLLGSAAAATLSGDRILAGLGSRLLKNLNGGSGAALGTLSITNRAGAGFDVDLSAARSVSDVIRLVNEAGATAGRGISAELNRAGNGILIRDASGGAGNLTITGGNAAVLGLEQSVAADSLDSGNLQLRYISEGTRLSALNGGRGVTRGKFTITDSGGISATIDLTQGNEVTIADVLGEINSRGLRLTARINDQGDGILLEDTGPGTVALTVTESGSTTAASLGLLGTAAAPGADLNGSFEKTINIASLLTVTSATLLADLNSGNGVYNRAGQADFRITARDGSAYEVDLDGAVTVGDVLTAIGTATGGQVTASVNATGTGLKLVDASTGTRTFQVEALGGASSAADLGILTTDGDKDGTIHGSAVVEITTLSQLAQKISDAGLNLRALVINDGSGGSPYRLSITSTVGGQGGAFLIDDGGLGLQAQNLVEAQDAVVFYGSSDPARALAITSPTNSLTSVLRGATIDLKGVSAGPVTLTISRDTDAVVKAVQSFVDSFNAVVETINKHDKYDPETKVRGLLLGDSTVANVRSSLYRLVNSRSTEISGQYTALSQVGLTLGSGAKLQLDSDKLLSALAADPSAVQNLFSYKQTQTTDGTTTTVAAGVGVRIEELLGRLTDVSTGLMKGRTDSLAKQIELGNKRIADLDKLLAAKRARLEFQFQAMETALSQLQTQSNAVGSLASLTLDSKG